VIALGNPRNKSEAVRRSMLGIACFGGALTLSFLLKLTAVGLVWDFMKTSNFGIS
jgi:hypothetical protein